MGQKNCKGGEEKELKSQMRNKKKQKKSKGTIVFTEKSITCIFTNADTLTNKFPELQTLLEIHRPDIIGVTEVKPKNITVPLTKAKLKINLIVFISIFLIALI